MSIPNPSPSAPSGPIAIIGAGLAGLACAQLLARAGHSVHVFDKSRGPSGRMSTRRGTDAGAHWQCDHGAPSFQAHDADFRAQVRSWQEAGATAPWPGRIGLHDGERLRLQDNAPQRFVGTPRMTSPAAHMVRGMQDMPDPVRFQWQTTVEPLQTAAGEGAGWMLHSPEHGAAPQRYRTVLLAVPAPQAVALVEAVAPEAARLARSARMRPCWSVMVRCAGPVPMAVDGCVVEHSPLRWIARDSSKPGRSGPETWLLQASHSWSEAHLEDDAQTVTAALLQAFARLGGPSPASVQATSHRWRYADATQPLHVDCWWSPASGLGLCGDWLHNGTVEGAWLSGRSLARAVHAAGQRHAA